MTIPKQFEPTRQQCRCVDFCPRNALAGSDFCDEHQPRVVAVVPPVLVPAPALPPGAIASKPKLDVEALMPFEASGGQTLLASPQKPFKPRGLMLWDAPPSLNVECIVIGNMHQVLVAYGKVPALWFQQAQTFEQVVAARAAGQEPASWGSWDALYPGVMVRLEFDGPANVRAVMWGHTL
jgi:hypothetical protein